MMNRLMKPRGLTVPQGRSSDAAAEARAAAANVRTDRHRTWMALSLRIEHEQEAQL